MANTDMERVFEDMGFTAKRAWPQAAVVYSIGRTYNALIRDLNQVYAQAGLSASSFNLLMLLKHGQDPDAHTQRLIGERLVVSASDMTGLIDRLERKGFVKRIAGADRRSKRLRITPKGEAVLGQLWDAHEKCIRRAASKLGEEDMHRLVQGLAKIQAQLQDKASE